MITDLTTGRTALLGIILLWSAIPAPGGAQSSEGAKTVSDTVSFSETGIVSIENQSGSIRVTTWDREAVGYDVRIEPTSQDSVALSTLSVDRSDDEIEFEIGDNSWSIQIPGIVRISPGGTTTPLAHFHVRIPQTADVQIDDHDSDIRVSGVTANVEINSYDGQVEVDSVDGTLNLDTFDGTVNATHLRGGTNIETYDGSVEASFDEFGGASSVDTYSGRVRVHLPPTTGFQLRGELDDMELSVAEAFGPPTIEDERRIYGGGGPPLSLESFSGRIEIRTPQSEESSEDS